jgi:hypothetical protein
MSYQVKRIIVSIITGVLILFAYFIYTYGKYKSGAVASDDIKFWAGTMLVFIGIGIAASIVIQIVFHILLSIAIAVKEKIRNDKCDEKGIDQLIKNEMVTDEMDKLIELKSNRISIYTFGIGFIASLVSLILNYSPAVMINIIFVSFSIGSLLEGSAQLIYYKRGVKNG